MRNTRGRSVRRSLEISAGFFDKLSVLNAGSIAVAASVTIAIIARPDLISSQFRSIVHGLVVIVFLLWASLICAVIRNFLSAIIAVFDAKYSDIEIVRRATRKGLAIARNNVSANDKVVVDQLERDAEKEPFQKQTRIVKRQRILHQCANVLGYASNSCSLLRTQLSHSFCFAYGEVVMCYQIRHLELGKEYQALLTS